MKNWRIIILPIVIFSMIFVTGCNYKSLPDTETQVDTEMHEDTEDASGDRVAEELFIEVGIPDDELSSMQKVLFNKEEYNDGQKIADVEGVYNDEFERRVTFCVVDLDHDGEDEVCLLYASGSVLIFHEIDGHIYGYDYSWRGFTPAYKDGTFVGSGGASYSAFYGNVSFTKDEFQREVITAIEYLNDAETVVYYKNGGSNTGTEISKEEYDQIMSQYEMIRVEEYDFTVENVLKYVK